MNPKPSDCYAVMFKGWRCCFDCPIYLQLHQHCHSYRGRHHNHQPYMQKTCDVAEKAILAKKNLRKKCVNRDKM